MNTSPLYIFHSSPTIRCERSRIALFFSIWREIHPWGPCVLQPSITLDWTSSVKLQKHSRQTPSSLMTSQGLQDWLGWTLGEQKRRSPELSIRPTKYIGRRHKTIHVYSLMRKYLYNYCYIYSIICWITQLCIRNFIRRKTF